jgi:cytochrome c biogenesis protein
VVVLLSLATLSIIGTLIPQNQSPEQYFRAFGAFRYQVLATLDVFDMYHSWWFQLLMVLLVVNIVVCSIDRLRVTAKIIFVKRPRFNLEGFRRRPSRRDFWVAADAQALKESYHQKIARQFRYCRVVPAGDGFVITAEKGRWTRLGVYGVHLSVVMLLLGALVGSLMGFEGRVNIAEGETVSAIQLSSSGLDLQLPFAVRCDDFDVQFYDTGAPKEFRSKLVILEKGQPTVEKEIIVNDPLRYKGINFFQSSYGKLNGQATLSKLPNEFELQFQSAASGMLYPFKASAGKSLSLPENLGSFIVTDYQAHAHFKNMEVGPSIVGTLTSEDGVVETILLPLNYPSFDKMRQGKVIITLGKDVMVAQDRYYTGLQVTKDPGVGLVYVGFCLMIMGCVVTFFMSHQQVVVEVQAQAGGSAVLVAGTSNKNRAGFQNRLQQMADKLAVLAAE